MLRFESGPLVTQAGGQRVGNQERGKIETHFRGEVGAPSLGYEASPHGFSDHDEIVSALLPDDEAPHAICR